MMTSIRLKKISISCWKNNKMQIPNQIPSTSASDFPEGIPFLVSLVDMTFVK